jgi:magnesium chelatase subunit D
MKNSPKKSKTQAATKLKLASQATPGCYPFAAIVGQDEMKLALILNVIDPSVGGVVMMGHRGTGKSTVVRALADLLPQTTVVAGCAYRCDPAVEAGLGCDCRQAAAAGAKLGRQKRPVNVVELPLCATVDRVCGTIDIDHALRGGLQRFVPGLLARANRGFLYIDEVNLLEDHLVDLLLDVATTGVNKVERESISVEHPARFVLVGSGNPEEGELRPQLLDRFGLYVEVRTEGELERRVEIVERRDAFDREPATFRLEYAAAQEQLRKNIGRAQKSLRNVKVLRPVLNLIARLCSDLKIDGHRGELTIVRAARALAAFEGRKQVAETDVKRVAIMSLRHRLRQDALEEAGSAERIEQALAKALAKGSAAGGGSGEDGDDGGRTHWSPNANDKPMRNSRGSEQSRARGVDPNGDVAADKKETTATLPVESGGLSELDFKNILTGGVKSPSRSQRTRHSKLAKAVYDRERGRYTRSVRSPKADSRIALDATLRALAASRSPVSSVTSEYQQGVPAGVLRFKLFKRKPGRLFIFAIDLSGSMALNRIAQAKGAMLALLRQSYVKRDSVAIVGFSGGSAELLLSPSRSILRARRILDSLRIGGGTPLSSGLVCVLQLARRAKPQTGDLTLLLLTDGRANVPRGQNGNNVRAHRQSLIESEVKLLGTELNKAGVRTILVDTQNRFTRNHSAQALARSLGAEYKVLSPDVAVSHPLFSGGQHDLI